MSAPTVPSDHTVLPAVPVTSDATAETSPTIIAKATLCAQSRLRQKNRRHKRIELEIPLTESALAFESSTNWQFSGFSKDIDDKTWTCSDVEIRISARRGSVMHVTFYLPPTVV
jgi:hypothetical protein